MHPNRAERGIWEGRTQGPTPPLAVGVEGVSPAGMEEIDSGRCHIALREHWDRRQVTLQSQLARRRISKGNRQLERGHGK